MNIGIMWIFAKHYAVKAWGIVTRYPWQMLAITLAISAYLGWSRADKWEGRAANEKAAHAQSIKNWQSAYAKAKEENLAEVAKIEAGYKSAIDKRKIEYVYVEKEYRGTLAARLGDDRLRVTSTEVNSSCPIGYGLPVISRMPGGVLQRDQAAIVSRSDLEIVAENQAKLEGLAGAWGDLSVANED